MHLLQSRMLCWVGMLAVLPHSCSPDVWSVFLVCSPCWFRGEQACPFPITTSFFTNVYRWILLNSAFTKRASWCFSFVHWRLNYTHWFCIPRINPRRFQYIIILMYQWIQCVNIFPCMFVKEIGLFLLSSSVRVSFW